MNKKLRGEREENESEEEEEGFLRHNPLVSVTSLPVHRATRVERSSLRLIPSQPLESDL